MPDLVGTVILLGVVQGALLAPVLWGRSQNQLPNRILATLVGAVALMLFFAYLGFRFGFQGHPHLLGWGAPLPFLFGPLIYLYAIALTRPLVRFDPRWIVHSLPFVADVLYMGQVFYLKGADEKLVLVRQVFAGHAPFSFQLVTSLEVVQAFVYLFLTWRALERYGAKMEGYFSDLARIDLRWLRALVLAHAGVWSVVLIATVLRAIGAPASALETVVDLGSSGAIFLTGYVSLWQSELATKASAAAAVEEQARAPEAELPAPAPIPAALPEPPTAPKYQRNRLDDAEARELVEKLEALMAKDELYRDSGLTLPTLADALGVPPHTLSQILNVRVGKRFFEFVNVYRTEALKAALSDPRTSDRGVLDLAFEVGFNSKSTLNGFFKKHTGMTPTEFRGRAGASKIVEKSAG